MHARKLHKKPAVSQTSLTSFRTQDFLTKQSAIYLPGAYGVWGSTKYYFTVNNSYVKSRLKILLFPFWHRDWRRVGVQDSAEAKSYAPPTRDVNAPDLYLPLMGFLTYILIAGYTKGASNQFSPDVIGNDASYCLVMQLIEIGILAACLYLLNSSISFLDLVSFSGYKYIVLVINTVVYQLAGSLAYYAALAYTGVAVSYFTRAMSKHEFSKLVQLEMLQVLELIRERKKIRRQNRAEREKEKQDKIALGLLPPPEPKVKLSNMMKVLGEQAVADPSAVERKVRQQMAQREKNHEMRNLARKLTPEERREKKLKKIKEDASGDIHAAVFRVFDLSNPQHRFKVDVNAQQYHLTGGVLCWPDSGCILVWQGMVAKRAFNNFRFQECSTSVTARKVMEAKHVVHYWDLLYSDPRLWVILASSILFATIRVAIAPLASSRVKSFSLLSMNNQPLTALAAEHSFDGDYVNRATSWEFLTTAVSTGYFAYDTWDYVLNRLYIKSPGIVAHHVVILICYISALTKTVGVPLLSLALACELHSAFMHLRKLMAMSGYSIPHSRLFGLVWVFFGMAFGGIAFIDVLNVQLLAQVSEELEAAREAYLEAQELDHPSPEVKLRYALALVKSKKRDDKVRGIGLLEDLLRDEFQTTECLYWLALTTFGLADFRASRDMVGIGVVGVAVVVAGIALRMMLRR
ncbi:hypothetical protein P43SY_005595 [Pythium insidiosum]|uniref:TLC domain-containing protein n=1 Tax=Pythium insidiosum TaxID=114742 RepID=A0AAD5LKW9_PYTIN|nr:hypothetical protein P43SY_005595 [Pythium insidiosum]